MYKTYYFLNTISVTTYNIIKAQMSLNIPKYPRKMHSPKITYIKRSSKSIKKCLYKEFDNMKI